MSSGARLPMAWPRSVNSLSSASRRTSSAQYKRWPLGDSAAWDRPWRRSQTRNVAAGMRNMREDAARQYPLVGAQAADPMTHVMALFPGDGAARPTVLVTQGQTATFTVAASGSDITYQWRRGGTDLAGATAASYTSVATAITDSGAAYSVRLCSGAQSANVCVDSSTATLSVTPIALNAASLAGTAGQSGSVDGTGALARFNTANYLATNAAGTLFVGDFGNSTVRAVTPAGVVSTLAGTAGAMGYADGTGAAARFRGNGGLAVDSAAVVLGDRPRLRNARGVLALTDHQLVVVADNALLLVTVP